MANEMLALIASLGVTYLLHSTLLLGGAWCLLRISRTRSYALREAVWKFAAVAGLITAPLQVLGDMSVPMLKLSLPQFSASQSIERVAPPMLDEPVALDQRMELVQIDAPPRGLQQFGGADEPQFTFPTLSDVDAPDTREQDAPSVDTFVREPQVATFDVQPPAAAPVAQVAGPVAESEVIIEPAVPAVGDLLRQLFGAGLFVVVAFGVARIAAQNWWFQRATSGWRVVESGPVHAALNALLQRRSIKRRITLLELQECADPVAFGVLRWRIALPAGLEQRLEPDELDALLAHEVAHLVRGDAAWLWFGRLLCAALPFQPLNFIAWRSWRRAAEFLCDDWALSESVSGLALARCLTSIAEWRMHERFPAVALSAVGHSSTLTERVERLVEENSRRDRWESGALRAGLTAVAVGIGLGLVVSGPRVEIAARSSFANDESPTDIKDVTGIQDRLDDGLSLIHAPSEFSLPLEGDSPSSDDELERLAQEIEVLNQELDAFQVALEEVSGESELTKAAARLHARRERLMAIYQQLLALRRRPQPSSGESEQPLNPELNSL